MTEPCSLVVFGSTGNLARNKLLPALFHLELAEQLAPSTHTGVPFRQSYARVALEPELHRSCP